MNNLKQCTKCKEYKELEMFTHDLRTELGRRSYCKKCDSLTARIYYQKNREKRVAYNAKRDIKAITYRMRELYPEKQRARDLLRKAVKKGTIIKGECVTTYADPCNGQVEAHHHLGYEGEHWKDVMWLCRRHHTYIHHGRLEDEISKYGIQETEKL